MDLTGLWTKPVENEITTLVAIRRQQRLSAEVA